MARRVKVDEMDRETYLRTELRAIHARIALCESGELPAHVEAAHRLRAEKTAKLLHELLEARRAAEGSAGPELSPEELEASLVGTLLSLPHDMLARILDQVPRGLRVVGR
jgi:hypothetical protein